MLDKEYLKINAFNCVFANKKSKLLQIHKFPNVTSAFIFSFNAIKNQNTINKE